MQSFHHSRARIFFEVICALAIAGSCVGAWQQTGASALLVAAAVAALHGLVHAFDMRRPKPAVAAASETAELATVPETVIPAIQPIVAPTPPPEAKATLSDRVGERDTVEAPAARPSRARRAKAASKGGGRAARTTKAKVSDVVAPPELTLSEPAPAENVIEIAAPAEAKAAQPTPIDETPVTSLTPPEKTQPAVPQRPDEASPVPLRPLFEPEPFLRQQRAAFGRKS